MPEWIKEVGYIFYSTLLDNSIISIPIVIVVVISFSCIYSERSWCSRVVGKEYVDSSEMPKGWNLPTREETKYPEKPGL
jgi:hypothetical protein